MSCKNKDWNLEDKSNNNLSYELQFNCIDMHTLELSTSESELILQWTKAFYHSRQTVSLDFSLQPRLMALINSQQRKISNETLSIHKTCKALMANFLIKPLLRIVHFVKLSPDFVSLDMDDQINLLNGGAMEMFICSATSLYDQISNKLLDVVSRELSIEKDRSSSYQSSITLTPSSSIGDIQLDVLKIIWNEVGIFIIISIDSVNKI